MGTKRALKHHSGKIDPCGPQIKNDPGTSFSLFQSACTVIGCLQRVVHGTENAHYQYEGGSDDVNDAIIDVKYRVDLATSPFVMSPRQS